MKPLFVPIAGLLMLLVACQSQEPSGQVSNAVSDYAGIYVSDGYPLRDQGYDWVGISIDPLSDSTAHVSVRSRIDQKKATCTFDSDASLTDSGRLVIPFEDKQFFLSLSGDSLKISVEDEKSNNLLFYFCSGGASLEGTYSRLHESIEEDQLSGEGFKKDLSLQAITFHVQELHKGFETQLVIEPSGLQVDNQQVTHRIYGWVSGAETEDLNSDGSPELMVYVRSSDGGVRTRVIGYSVNDGKSMSQVAIPDFHDTPEASAGYLGYDEFSIVENSLVQRFPVFEKTDLGYEPTGAIRQIQYRLHEGEATRQFVIENMTTY
ncbi:MAG: hypothetical protein ACWGNV_16700 [Bacteroidales bacterium]